MPLRPVAVLTRATVSERVLRRVSAWALPRPSAMASAKLAKSTVNHSQAPTRAAKPSVSRTARTVVRTLPTSTTNMTGLRAMSRGSSLTKLSLTARPRMARSKRELERRLAGGRSAGAGDWASLAVCMGLEEVMA